MSDEKVFDKPEEIVASEEDAALLAECGGVLLERPKKLRGGARTLAMAEEFERKLESGEIKPRRAGNPNFVKGKGNPYNKKTIRERAIEKAGAIENWAGRCRVWMNDEGWKRLTNIASDKEHPRHFDALKLLAEYGHGKPVQQIGLGVSVVQLASDIKEKLENALCGVRRIGRGIPAITESAEIAQDERGIPGGGEVQPIN